MYVATPKYGKGDPDYGKESADELTTYSGEPVPDNQNARSSEPETPLRLDDNDEISGWT